MTINKSKFFLKKIKIDAFGKFSNEIIGDFCPGLNVLYGKNEAGKSTIAAFIQGVCIGWPRLNKRKKIENTYKTKDNNRIGSLFFIEKDSNQQVILTRINNKELEIIGNAENISIPEKEDFETMFSLTSDRLWDLGDKEAEITSQFLTAETGTEVAPATAIDKIEKEIKRYISKDGRNKDVSLKLFEENIEDIQYWIATEKTKEQIVEKESKKLPKIKQELNNKQTKIDEAEQNLKKLELAKVKIEVLNKDLQRLKERKLKSEETLTATVKECIPESKEYVFNTIKINDSNKHIEEIKSNTNTDSEKDINKNISEKDNVKKEKQQWNQKSFTLVTVACVCFVFAIAFGVFGFTTNEKIPLWFASVGCLVLAIILLVFELIFRKKEKQKLTQQDFDTTKEIINNQKLESRQTSEQTNKEQQKIEYQAKIKQLSAEIIQIKKDINEKQLLKAQVLSEIALSTSTELNNLKTEIEHIEAQVKFLKEQYNNWNKKILEIENSINLTKSTSLKKAYELELSQVFSKKETALKDFCMLFLAKQILVTANENWKKQSQPQVYKDAARFFSLMTDNKWTKIFMDKNKLYIEDRDKNVCQPNILSLSTRQQLYLSLRLAILLRPESSGKSIPVLADDILVNFDKDRRKNAAKALLELAKTKQIIIFTCHKDIVETIQQQSNNQKTTICVVNL